MKHAFSAFVLCAVLGVAIAGCQGSQASSAAAPGSATAAAPPTATAAAPSAPASPTGTAAPPAAAPTPTATALADAGVVSACDAPPHLLSREPSVIILACADAGIGVQDLTWTSWTASSATGQGVLWENECVPTASCGASKYSRYPVAVTLSAVKASAQGPWFSRLTVTWKDGRPPNQTPDTFSLEGPG